MGKYILFVLKNNLYFEEGTLLELEETIHEKGYSLPDKGNGESGFINAESVFVCPPFPENIPPSKCPVKITSINAFDNGKPENILKSDPVSVFESIHFQQIRIQLPDEFNEVNKMIFTDRLKGYEQYNLDNFSTKKIDEKNILSIEVSHIPPGFYEIILDVKESLSIKITCIKFYPDYLKKHFLPEEKNQKNLIPERNKVIVQREIIDVNDPEEKKNFALELVTEWGENYNKPIDDRIHKVYPDLTAEEILSLTKASRETESFIYATCERELDGKITELEIVPIVRAKYPWLSDNNIFRLKISGCFTQENNYIYVNQTTKKNV